MDQEKREMADEKGCGWGRGYISLLRLERGVGRERAIGTGQGLGPGSRRGRLLAEDQNGQARSGCVVCRGVYSDRG